MKILIDKKFGTTNYYLYDSVEEYLAVLENPKKYKKQTLADFFAKLTVYAIPPNILLNLKIEDMRTSAGTKIKHDFTIGGMAQIIPLPDKEIPYNKIDFILSDKKRRITAYVESNMINAWTDAVYAQRGDEIRISGYSVGKNFEICTLINNSFRKRQGLATEDFSIDKTDYKIREVKII